MEKKVIMIGNDHGGYDLKLILVEYLRGKGFQVTDAGSHSKEIVRYPYYASLVANAVSSGKAWRGILICSTGIGMSIAANKYKGVRAALCITPHQGKMTSAHNNSNILCLGGGVVSGGEALEILENWLDTAYEGGRHDISLNLITDAEGINFSGESWMPDIPKNQ